MSKSTKYRRWFISLGILLALLLLWSRSCNLAYLIAQQRPVLLGRYTESYFLLLMISTALAAWLIFAILKKRSLLPWRGVERQNLFKTFTLLFSLLLVFISIDCALRLRRGGYYEDPDEAGFYSRPPHQHYTGTYHDLPAYPFSYPEPRAGAAAVPYVFTTDAFGFRNQLALADSYSWLAIGDSFAEGSRVSDQDVWVDRLQSHLPKPLYNCGISGGSPLTYLALLKVQGAKINSDGVLCMLYEGNDFRASNFHDAKKGGRRWRGWPKYYFQTSPLRRLGKLQLLKIAGKIGSRRFAGKQEVTQPEHPLYPVSWLPLEITAENQTAHFAFNVKRLQEHLVTEEDFKNSRGAQETMRLLREMQRKCQQQKQKLVLIYAPDAPHVLMEAMAAKIPAVQVAAFLATAKKRLLETDNIWEELLRGCEVREMVIKQFCEQEDITFLSLTEPLKQATARGEQTYFCYDQHWAPRGHEVVADFLAAKLLALASEQDESAATEE